MGGRLVVIDTFEGLRACAVGTCRVCGHQAEGLFDMGVRGIDGGAYEFDEEAQADCPECEVSGALELRLPDPSTDPVKPAGEPCSIRQRTAAIDAARGRARSPGAAGARSGNPPAADDVR